MTRSISSQTAVVRFTGLGVLCLDQRNGRAENYFIHDENHWLTVEIFKPFHPNVNDAFNADPGDAEARPTYRQFYFSLSQESHWYKRIAVYQDLDLMQIDQNGRTAELTIDIAGYNNDDTLPLIDSWGKYKVGGDDFPREDLSATDRPNDFRWMVNIKKGELFGPDAAFSKDNVNRFPHSNLYIKNAELYTELLAGSESAPPPAAEALGAPAPPAPIVYKKVGHGPDNSLVYDAPADYGMLAGEMGALIDSDFVQVIIQIGDERTIHNLPKLDVMPYVIYVRNNAPNAESDMPIYRKLWGIDDNDSLSGTFDILTETEVSARQITAREICSGVWTEWPES